MAQERTDMAGTRTDLARERSRAAAERTLMAWIRTSLSMISFGFGIDRFFTYLKQTDTTPAINTLSEERILGFSLITLGIFALIAASVTHWQTLRRIDRQEYRYTPTWSLGLVVAIVLTFVGLATYVPLLTTDLDLSVLMGLDSQIVRNLVTLTVFVIMLTMGVNLSLAELTSLWQRPGLLGRSLLTVLGLFPLGVVLVVVGLDLPDSATIGLALLAAAPGAPLLTKRAQMAGADFAFAASLQVILSLVAVLYTPLLLFGLGMLLPAVTEGAAPLVVAQQVAMVQLLPLSIGLVIRQIWAALADEIGDFLTTIANTLFLVLALLLLVMSLDLIPQLGPRCIGAIGGVTALALGMGHFLGGPEPEMRSGFAIATVARNAGLALFIALLNDQATVIPMILAYLILSAAVTVPYSVRMRRKA